MGLLTARHIGDIKPLWGTPHGVQITAQCPTLGSRLGREKECGERSSSRLWDVPLVTCKGLNGLWGE